MFGKSCTENLCTLLFQYWMYKFRDPSSEDLHLDHKTELQANFVSYSSITQSIPAVITTILATRYAHKINIRTRLMTTITLILTAYVIFTAFIKINTDTCKLLQFRCNDSIHCSGEIFNVERSIQRILAKVSN